jgi:hypothetical protein
MALLFLANKATHLGIERISTGNNRKELVQTRITTARRTVFALMGAGLHGLNGVNPKVAIHLIQIYVMPRLLYDLEITTLRQNEIQKLEIYLKKLLKASFTLTAAIVTANGSVPQLDQILWQCPYLASDKCRNFSELLFSASFTI